MNTPLPKRLSAYIHDTGVRTLDHLADNVSPAEGPAAEAIHKLVDHWRAMSREEKDEFVRRLSVSVGEVIAASALLPLGLEVGKKAVKSARKVLSRSAKTLKKAAKKQPKAGKTKKVKAKKVKTAPAKPKKKKKVA